jgi:CHAT domain-containing protein
MVQHAVVFVLVALAACGSLRPRDGGDPRIPDPGASGAARETLASLRGALEGGDRDGARSLLREAVAALRAPEPGREATEVAFLLELDRLARELGSLEESKRVCELVLELRARTLPADHPELLDAKQSLGATRYALGDFSGARALYEEVYEARSRLLPPDHPDLLEAKRNVAAARCMQGDLQEAHVLFLEVYEAQARALPADHPDLLRTKQSLAVTRKMRGDLRGARELEEEVLAARARVLLPEDPSLLSTKNNLAVTRMALGDRPGARALFEEVHEARSRLLPADHPELLNAKQNLAGVLCDLGDLQGALALEEEVLAARTRLLPADHSDLQAAKVNLAVTKCRLGDLPGAHALFEEALAVLARSLAADHPELLKVKQNLSVTRFLLGDLAGARELSEEVLAARSGSFPSDHPELLAAQLNHAVMLRNLGDPAAAEELGEQVLAAQARLLPPDHPELLDAMQNLAVAKQALGDVEGARGLFEEVLAAQSSLPPDHPYLLAAKLNLVTLRYVRGDFSGSAELSEDVLDSWSALLPVGHPQLFAARLNLALTRKALGDLRGAREVLSSLLEGLRARAAWLRLEAARASREGARTALEQLCDAISASAGTDGSETLDPQVFETLESLRLVSVASSETRHALPRHPRLAQALRESAGARSRINDLVAAGPGSGSSIEAWRMELLRLAEERDRNEREVRSELREVGLFLGEIEDGAIGGALEPGAAAASFFRYPRRFDRDPKTGESPPSEDSLLAFVVLPGGTLERIELEPALELEAAVRGWRAAVGWPLDARGEPVVEAASRSEDLEALGRRLRERVLDPVIGAAGEVRTLHVVLDDLLHLVPLDALPLDDGFVGQRLAIRHEISFARLLRPVSELAGEGELTLLGGVDYGAELDTHEVLRLDAQTSPLDVTALRSRSGVGGFAFRPGTLEEARSIHALYKEVFGREPVMLTQGGATKAALLAAAPRARWLHLATHGWFAPETLRSQLDSQAERGARDPWQRAQATLVGFAPETLCGLALAGANRGQDALGRVPGILTAEELAAFDLRDCELAVLSACETNVGIRRAGQGIQSLQSALHAAGARTAITSLWRVDDAATQRLFELFYAQLWKRKLGKADALWQAKMALRAEGHPPRDWAAWMLTGAPD